MESVLGKSLWWHHGGWEELYAWNQGKQQEDSGISPGNMSPELRDQMLRWREGLLPCPLFPFFFFPCKASAVWKTSNSKSPLRLLWLQWERKKKKKKTLHIFSSCHILKTAILSHYISEYCVIANLWPRKFSILAFKVNIRYNRKPVTQNLPLDSSKVFKILYVMSEKKV